MNATATTFTRQDLVDHFREFLHTITKERLSRMDMKVINNGYGLMVPEWVFYEREVMENEVNRLRAENGREPITQREIIRVENLAEVLNLLDEHDEYVFQYALGATELVLD